MPAHAQTRYAAGLEKMSINGIPATFGEVAKNEWANALERVGQVRRARFHVAQRGPARRQAGQRQDPARRRMLPRALQANCTENQMYWTMRWADQMNYRYWKERCQAEMTTDGVLARQLFYEGTVAYKTGDFPKAAEKFKEGLEIWKTVMDDFPDLSRRRSQQERHRSDRQAVCPRAQADTGRRSPTIFRSRTICQLVQNDTTVDPFDAIEMIGVVGDASADVAAERPAAPRLGPRLRAAGRAEESGRGLTSRPDAAPGRRADHSTPVVRREAAVAGIGEPIWTYRTGATSGRRRLLVRARRRQSRRVVA